MKKRSKGRALRTKAKAVRSDDASLYSIVEPQTNAPHGPSAPSIISGQYDLSDLALYPTIEDENTPPAKPVASQKYVTEKHHVCSGQKLFSFIDCDHSITDFAGLVKQSLSGEDYENLYSLLITLSKDAEDMTFMHFPSITKFYFTYCKQKSNGDDLPALVELILDKIKQLRPQHVVMIKMPRNHQESIKAMFGQLHAMIQCMSTIGSLRVIHCGGALCFPAVDFVKMYRMNKATLYIDAVQFKTSEVMKKRPLEWKVLISKADDLLDQFYSEYHNALTPMPHY